MSDQPLHVFSRQFVLAEVETERLRQDAKWGGPDHDDEHEYYDFVRFVREHTDAARLALNNGRIDEWRIEMIQIAALCVAAVESHKRRTK